MVGMTAVLALVVFMLYSGSGAGNRDDGDSSRSVDGKCSGGSGVKKNALSIV